MIKANDYSIVLANQAALGGQKKGGRHTGYELTHNRTSPCLSAEYPCPLGVVKKTKKPALVEHIHFDSKGSLGIAIFPGNGDDPESLVKYADTAMYSVKGQSGGGYACYRKARVGSPRNKEKRR